VHELCEEAVEMQLAMSNRQLAKVAEFLKAKSACPLPIVHCQLKKEPYGALLILKPYGVSI